MNENDLLILRQRIGDDHLGQRLRAQVDHSLQLIGQGRGRLHFENLSLLMRAIDVGLRVSGLYHRAQRNALALTVRERKVSIDGLPTAFSGFRILHLSDLHLDGYPGFGRYIAERLHGHEFDLAVLTGDFRFHSGGSYQPVKTELEALVSALTCRFGIYGILGNHDFIEMVPLIEQAGVRLLLNEAVMLEMNDDRLWLVGLDDAHFYGVHNFARALNGIPSEDPRLLLVHSPEVIAEAAANGFCLYLTGHTHGGQICLPGGYAPFFNARCSRKQSIGAWRENQMEGYTSAGVGSSGVFGRFFCPPEIVIHQLVSMA